MIAGKTVAMIKGKDISSGQLLDGLGVLANDVAQGTLHDQRLDVRMEAHGLRTKLMREEKTIAIFKHLVLIGHKVAESSTQ